jgi:hypothetical protein
MTRRHAYATHCIFFFLHSQSGKSTTLAALTRQAAVTEQ